MKWLLLAGVLGVYFAARQVDIGVRVENGRRVLKSASGYQTVSMLDGSRTGLYYDLGELAGELRPQARRVVLLGLGGGEMLRAARRTLPQAEMVGVDVDAHVVTAAIASFGVLELRVLPVVADAWDWLEVTPRGSIDVLLVDVYVDATLPERFRSRAFYEMAHRATRPDGLLMQNVWPPELVPDVEKALHRAGWRNVRRVPAGPNAMVLADR